MFIKYCPLIIVVTNCFLFSFSEARAQDVFVQHVREMVDNREYTVLIHEAHEFVNSLETEHYDAGLAIRASRLRDMLFDLMYSEDAESGLRAECNSIIRKICIFELRNWLNRIKGPFTAELLPVGRFRAIEILIGVGDTKNACDFLQEINAYINSDLTIDNYLHTVKYDNSPFVDTMELQLYGLTLISVLPLFCDETLSEKERNEKIAAFLTPYRGAPWVSSVVKRLAYSSMWGNTHFCQLMSRDQLQRYYAFLWAIEPLAREYPHEEEYSRFFYVKLEKVANTLERYDDLVKLYNVLLARATTPGDINRARWQLSDAVRKLREHQSASHPHEEDIKMMEELGLFE